MNKRDRRTHHPHIAVGQIIKHLLAFRTLQFHIIRNNSGIVVVLILFSLPVRDIRFDPQQSVLDFPDRFVCGDRKDVNQKHHRSVH